MHNLPDPDSFPHEVNVLNDISGSYTVYRQEIIYKKKKTPTQSALEFFFYDSFLFFFFLFF